MTDIEHDFHRSAEEADFEEALEILVRAQRRLGVEACRDKIAAFIDDVCEDGEDTDTDGILLLERVSTAFKVLGGYQEGLDRVIELADLTVGWSAQFQWDHCAGASGGAYEEAIRGGVDRMLHRSGGDA